MDALRTFVADEAGDTSSGVAVGALLVVLVVVLIFVLQGGFPGQPQQSPGIDINIRPGS